MPQHQHHVLQRVAGGPLPVRAGKVGAGVHQADEGGDRRRVGRVVRRPQSDSPSTGCSGGGAHLDRFDVGGEPAVRAAHVACPRRRRSAPGTPRSCRAAHRPRHRRHDDDRQPEPLERLDVGVAMALVRRVQPGVVDVEAVRVLHHELPAPEQPGPWPGLVAELRLDLVDDQRQVLVRRVQVLHEQREHLLVGRREEEVVAATVLEPEQVVAVLLQRFVASYGARGSRAGKCTSWKPAAFISARMISSTLRYTSQPSGSHVNPPGAARRM